MTRRPFTPAWFLPGPHLPTLWGKFVRRTPLPPARTVRWETPDGDFVDVLHLEASRAAPDAPHLILLHGLEGKPHSHYVRGTLAEAVRRGWSADLLIFRTCGDEPNRTRRFYHSGETTDLAFVVDRIAREQPERPLLFAGFSLGGNVLLKWLGERGDSLPAAARGAVAVSVPYDLERGSRHIQRGFARVYERHFLRSLRRKATEKLGRFPGLFDIERFAAARTLYDFDDVVTGPVHGFADARDYYSRSSSLGFLAGIRLPTLLLSAADDPFLPAAVLDDVRRVAASNPSLELEFLPRGGHVGFVSGRLPWRPFYYAEWRLGEFLSGCVARRTRAGDAAAADPVADARRAG